MDCRPLGSSFHGISQARIREWIAILFSKGIFPTQGSNPCLLHWQVVFTTEPPGKPKRPEIKSKFSSQNGVK